MVCADVARDERARAVAARRSLRGRAYRDDPAGRDDQVRARQFRRVERDGHAADQRYGAGW